MVMGTDILVVDDDRDVRETVAAVLDGEGYRVRCAENGAQALAMLHGAKPSAIILDLMMPVMNGWELLQIVRDDAELCRIPVVVLSAMRAPFEMPHLAKPVSLEELIHMLDRVCHR
jgi:CheY-like chemotaxis protein